MATKQQETGGRSSNARNADADQAKSSGVGRTVAIGAASGVVAGLLANLVRKAAVQAPRPWPGNGARALLAELAPRSK